MSGYMLMRRLLLLGGMLLSGCDAPAAQPEARPDGPPPYGTARAFAGKLEGNWEYVRFRECGTPEGCAKAVHSCGVEVTKAARDDFSKRTSRHDEYYWIEFIGRRRGATRAELTDNLDAQDCFVEVQQLVRACESSSPIYPDGDGKRPDCASPAGPIARAGGLDG